MDSEQVKLKKSLFTWFSSHNLDLITCFHSFQYQSLQDKLNLVNCELVNCNNKEQKKELVSKNTYLRQFERQLRINTFLMMYSYLEEFFYIIWKSFDKTIIIDKKGSIKRFKLIIEKIFKFNLEKDREWKMLCDYEKIRDCILHCNCNVSIYKYKKDLMSIGSNSSYSMKIEKNRIELTEEFLVIMKHTIETFIKRIENINCCN